MSGAELATFLKSAEDRASRSVCPIYERDMKRPLVGSSLLLRIDSTLLLITANHVLGSHKDLYVWGSNGQVGLRGRLYREKDWDFAFMRLGDELVAQLEIYRPIDPGEIATEDLSPVTVLYMFAGFPETKNRPKHRTLQRHVGTFLVEPKGGKQYELAGVRPETHLVADFNRRKLKAGGITGTVTGPNPSGLSGGGVWRMPLSHSDGGAVEQLVGIGLEYRSSYHLLVALRMGVIVATIACVYPELATRLPRPKHLGARVALAPLAGRF